MRKFFVCMFLALAFFSEGVFAQQINIRDMNEALSSGAVTLAASGNGSSSGASVMGILGNNTAAEIFIDVTISKGLYLVNSGEGQNMLAIQVFLSTGAYTISGNDKFIQLPPNAHIPVMLIAFCADFDRENPGPSETFAAASMPRDMEGIAAKISRYTADNFDDENLTAPVQLALWRSRGQSRSNIAKKFEFSSAEWNLSTRIMNY